VATQPMGSFWFQSKDRATATRIGMWATPKVAPVRAYNLWKGFAVKPQPGDWSKMRWHIQQNIANGDSLLAEYIIKWLAWMFQNPGERTEVALVLIGTEGTGKGMLANTVIKIFGRQARKISADIDPKFNAQLQGCVFLNVDEAEWDWRKGKGGGVKRMITEPTLGIEPKGVDAFEIDNVLHILITTNEKWAIPAGPDARRFQVCEVSSSKRRNPAYFDALQFEISNGGVEAMLHDLSALDLGGWHPRDIIDNAALQNQKVQSLPYEERYVHDLLESGELPHARKVENGYFVATTKLKEHAIDCDPGMRNRRIDVLLKTLESIGCVKGRGVAANRERGVIFPNLAEARRQWNDNHFSVTWPAREDWDVD
jgi:hypothetical protein